MHVDILNLGDRPEGVCSVLLLAKPRNRRIRSPLTQWLLRDGQPPGRTTREAPVRLTLPLAAIGAVLHESHRVSQVAIGVVLASSSEPAYLPRRRSARRRLARNLCAAVQADWQQRMRAVEHRPRRNRAVQEAFRRGRSAPLHQRDELA